MKTALTIVLLLYSYLSAATQIKLQTGQYLLTETGTTIVSLAGTDETLRADPNPVLTIQDFEEAIVAYPETMTGNVKTILIKLTPEGQYKFMDFTKKNVGKSSGTVIGGKLYTAIQITTTLEIGYVEIPVSGTRRKAKQLVKALNTEIKRAN